MVRHIKSALLFATLSISCVTSLAATEVVIYKADRLIDADGISSDAIAVKEGRIVKRGEIEVLRSSYSSAQLVELEGSMMPGLIDGHGHLLGLGGMLQSVDLSTATSLQDALARVKAFAEANPDIPWIVGGWWDQNDWPVKEFPTAADLDSVVTDRPVWLSRIDGHAKWGNSKAIALADRDLSGIWQPKGGQIIRDKSGRASGVFIDAAEAIIDSKIPAPTQQQVIEKYTTAFNHLASLGITGVHDAGVSLSELKALEKMADDQTLTIRTYAMADGNAKALAALCEQGPYLHGSGLLEMRSVKIYLDGALGSRGAALRQDYSDDPGNKGLMLVEPEDLAALLSRANGCQLQINAHAIGDAANELLANTIAVLPPQSKPTRHRIEHAQVVDDAMIGVMAKAGIAASMQPTHATSDMPWVGERLGEQRLHGAYAWRSFVDAGVPLILGSDFPVERANPFEGLYAAITRQDRTGHPKEGWYPEQRLTFFEALSGFTRSAAWGAFNDHQQGDLKQGFVADFIVVRGLDPQQPESLLKTKVTTTVVNGKVVYSKQ